MHELVGCKTKTPVKKRMHKTIKSRPMKVNGEEMASIPPQQHGILLDCVCGALAAMGACIFSNPVDVVKARFQVQGEMNRNIRQRPYRSLTRSAAAMVKTEGISAMQKGLAAALTYNGILNFTRFGSYTAFTQFTGARRSSDSAVDASANLGAGFCAGALAGMIASPLALLRTRMQIESSSASLRVGWQHTTPGLAQGIRTLIADGHASGSTLRGVFSGSSAQGLRNGVGTTAQFVCYDAVKAKLLSVVGNRRRNNGGSRDEWNGDHWVHMAAASVSAAATAIVINPVDLVATRVYNQRVATNSGQVPASPP